VRCDNPDLLREHIADASVDPLYLDPPINSNAGYTNPRVAAA